MSGRGHQPARAVREYLGDVDILGSAEELLARDDIDLVVDRLAQHCCTLPQAAAALRRRQACRRRKARLPRRAAEVSDLEQLATQHNRKIRGVSEPPLGQRFPDHRETDRRRTGSAPSIPITRAGIASGRKSPSAGASAMMPGHGMLYDLGSHLIDQALVLFGEPEWLYANVFTQRENSVIVDGFEILHGQGLAAHHLGVSLICARRRLSLSRQRFARLVPEGRARPAGRSAARRHGAGRTFLRRRADGTMGHAWLTARPGSAKSSSPRPAAGSPFTNACARAIEQDGPVPVSAGEAYATIRVIEAALTSSAMGCRIDLQPAAPPVSR